MSERESNPPREETEEVGTEIDPIDPLKRDTDDDETMPGLDPVVSPIPPD